MVEIIINNEDNVDQKKYENMSLITLTQCRDGILLTSDTRSTNFKYNVRVQADDDFEKITKINDNLYIFITGDNTINNEKISDLIKLKNPNNFNDICNICKIFIGLCDSQIYTLELDKQTVNLTEINIIKNYNSFGYIIKNFEQLSPYNYNNEIKFLCFGADYMINFLENDMLIDHLKIKDYDDIVNFNKKVFKTAYYMSELTKYKTINQYIDMFFYDFNDCVMKQIKKHESVI